MSRAGHLFLHTWICVTIFLSSIGHAEVITSHMFQQWGDELLTLMQSDFGRSDGLYKPSLTNTGADYAWGQGVMANALAAAAKVDSSYLERAKKQADALHDHYWCTQNGTSGYNAGYGGCGDRYYDDNAWIALALVELYKLTDNDKYLTWARETVAFCMTGENGPNDSPDGGIRWHESNTSGASVCSTAPTMLANLLIYQLTGIESYKTDGSRLYHWIINSNLRYSSWIFHETNQGPLGYQTAVVTQTATRLFQITGDTTYLADAQRMANAMESQFINSTSHYLGQTGKWGGHDMTNAYADLYEVDHNTRWLTIAVGYLVYLHDNCIDPENGLYPTSWNNTTTSSGALIDNASVARAFWRMADTPGGTTPDAGYTPTAVIPYISTGGDWAQTDRIILDPGDSFSLKAQASGNGTYRWDGPGTFTATGSQITLSNIQPDQAGYYCAVFTNTSNVESFCAVHVTVNTALTLYQHCDYGGWEAVFGLGAYTLADIIAAGGVKNNDASSMKIVPGYKVTFYDYDNFQDSTLVKTADRTCFVDDGWNDRVTSMIVEGQTAPGGYWQFNDNGGSVADDSSANSDDGQLINMDQASWTIGKQCGGLDFDGVDDYVEITDYKGVTGYAARTCMAWIKTSSISKVILSWGEDYAGGRWVIRVNEGGQLRAEVAGGFITGTTLINDGRWHHIAVSLESDGSPDIMEARLYVDGNLETISAVVDEPVNTGSFQDVRIGMYYVGERWFNGRIDEVKIYDRALSVFDIQNIYQTHALTADTEPDGDVDFNDFAVLVEFWQNTDTCDGDLTCDCIVDFNDFLILSEEWLQSL